MHANEVRVVAQTGVSKWNFPSFPDPGTSIFSFLASPVPYLNKLDH